jgi:hypothetical protein
MPAPFFLEKSIMSQFEAEVLFPHADAARAVETLAAIGCTYDINTDIADEDYVFGWARGAIELDEMEIGDWLIGIVEPFGGDVIEWCLVELRDERLRRARS